MCILMMKKGLSLEFVGLVVGEKRGRTRGTTAEGRRKVIVLMGGKRGEGLERP